MNKDSTVVHFPQPEVVADPLTAVLRSGARRLLAQAIEAEAEAFLAEMADRRLADGRARVVRHGHGPERTIQTGIGPVEVRRAKVRDRAPAESGERVRFTSNILPRWARRTASLEALLPVLYLRGISTGDFQEALAALLGKDAPNLSPSVIARLKGDWQADYERWQKRDLSARRYVYIWADGVYLQARMEPQAECMLVVIGATPEGKKELVGFQVGVRESAQSWRELLVGLRARGLVIAPEVAVGDGALGFWKALEEIFPSTRHQRCWVHSVPRGHIRYIKRRFFSCDDRAVSVSLYPPAGGSPVRVITREPGSRLPASGGNAWRRSAVSKALQGEQRTGPQHQANSAAS